MKMFPEFRPWSKPEYPKHNTHSNPRGKTPTNTAGQTHTNPTDRTHPTKTNDPPPRPDKANDPPPRPDKAKTGEKCTANLCMVIDQACGHLDGWISIKIMFVCLSSCSPVSRPVVVQFNMQTKIKANIQPSPLFKTGQKGYLMCHT